MVGIRSIDKFVNSHCPLPMPKKREWKERWFQCAIAGQYWSLRWIRLANRYLIHYIASFRAVRITFHLSHFHLLILVLWFQRFDFTFNLPSNDQNEREKNRILADTLFFCSSNACLLLLVLESVQEYVKKKEYAHAYMLPKKANTFATLGQRECKVKLGHSVLPIQISQRIFKNKSNWIWHMMRLRIRPARPMDTDSITTNLSQTRKGSVINNRPAMFCRVYTHICVQIVFVWLVVCL